MIKHHSESIWQNIKNQQASYPKLSEDIDCDVLVVGAGITGLSCAYHLAKQNKKVVVIEAKNIGSGTTGQSTAHLTTWWDHDYVRISQEIDYDTSQLAASALQKGLSLIEKQTEGKHCEFEKVNGYLFDEDGSHQEEIGKKYDMARSLGLDVQLTSSSPLSFASKSSLMLGGQAMINPLSYLQLLAKKITEMGVQIFENTRLTDFSTQSPFDVQCADQLIHSKELVFATHTPLGMNLLHGLNPPYRSYVAAAQIQGHFPKALFWDMQNPYHYLRPYYNHGGQRLVLVGGNDRKTGHGDELKCFASLRTYIHRHFKGAKIIKEWSAQLYEPIDSIPFIGRSPVARDLFLATGYSGDGLTMGSFAGWEIAQQIEGNKTEWTDCFTPHRLLKTGYTSFFRENFDVAKCMISGRLFAEADGKLDSLVPGEGAVVGPRHSPRAVYRNADGSLREMSAVCPHMGCIVEWNPANHSFDCPCHGARFEASGKVLEGPALTGLQRLKERNLPYSQKTT